MVIKTFHYINFNTLVKWKKKYKNKKTNINHWGGFGVVQVSSKLSFKGYFVNIFGNTKLRKLSENLNFRIAGFQKHF